MSFARLLIELKFAFVETLYERGNREIETQIMAIFWFSLLLRFTSASSFLVFGDHWSWLRREKKNVKKTFQLMRSNEKRKNSSLESKSIFF